MRATEGYFPTLKEKPNDAELVSHQLMLRAGLIRKLGSGLYTWLPLGLKVLRHVERIVREEMDRAGGLEVLMPAVQPAELWEETGRWGTFGDQLLVMKDSHDRAYCFGPTHEEVITDLLRHEIKSYKQLPMQFYQIQTKFRDEIRPRFGVMRAREFIMKDAYSFHLGEASLQTMYDTFYHTYCTIFDRLGLTYRAVEADTGAIGGAVSHEFQVLAEAGEDVIAYSDQSDYAANIEQATSLCPSPTTAIPTALLETLHTPKQKSIAEVATFLNVEPQSILKTLIVAGTTHPWVALVLRGDDELNPIKAAKHPLIRSPLQFADEQTITQALHLFMGYIGPVHLSLPIIADWHAAALSDFICGANQPDTHYRHAAWHRDALYETCADLRTVKAGDPSPDGQGHLALCRGIEVGHIFQLGDRYTQAMQMSVVNEQGHLETPLMGCYGLGISRIVAASIEQHHDDRGICWPAAIAPFQVVIIPIHAQRSQAVSEAALRLYTELKAAHIDVLWDDRPERPGVLFADSDLLGIPHRLVISDRHLEHQCVEYKARSQAEPQLVTLAELPAFLSNLFHK